MKGIIAVAAFAVVLALCASTASAQPVGARGDPHITTVNGNDYTFNAVGDFVLAYFSDTTNDYVLQAKLEAVSANGQFGSKITAIAAYDQNAGETVELFANGDLFFTDLSTSTVAAGGGAIAAAVVGGDGDPYDEYTFTFNSGDVFNVELVDGAFNVEVTTADDTLGGLLGNSDGSATTDYTPFPVSSSSPLAATASDEDLFYDFGWSWSAANADLFGLGSLFSVAGPTEVGANIPTFSPVFQSQQHQDIATDVCKFLTDAVEQARCEFDVAIQDDYLASNGIIFADDILEVAYTGCTPDDCTIADSESSNLVDGCNRLLHFGCETITLTSGATRGQLLVGDSVDTDTDQYSYPGIETIVGDLDITSADAVTVNFDYLEVVEGSIFINSATLEDIYFPKLTLVTGGIFIAEAAAALVSIDLSALTEVDCLVVEAPELLELNLPNLNVMNSLLVRGAAKLTTISAPNMHTLTEGLTIDGTVPDLATLDLDSLANTRAVAIVGTKLTSVSLPSLTSVSGCDPEHSFQVRGSRDFEGGNAATAQLAGNGGADFNDFAATDSNGDFGAASDIVWQYQRLPDTDGDPPVEYTPDDNSADIACPAPHDETAVAPVWFTEYCYYPETSITIEGNTLLESVYIGDLETAWWVRIHNNEKLTSINMNDLVTASGMTVTMNVELASLAFPSLTEVTYAQWRPSWGHGTTPDPWDDNAATTGNWGTGAAGLNAEPNEAVNLVNNVDLIHSLLYGNNKLTSLDLSSLTTLHGDLVLGGNVYRLLDYCANAQPAANQINAHTYESLEVLKLDSLQHIVGYPFDEHPNWPNSIFIDLHEDNGMVCGATSDLELDRDLEAGGALSALSLPSLVTVADVLVSGAAELATISIPMWTGPSDFGVDDDADNTYFGGAAKRPAYFLADVCSQASQPDTATCLVGCADDCAVTASDGLETCSAYGLGAVDAVWDFSSHGDVFVAHNPTLTVLNLGSLEHAAVVTITANKRLRTADLDALAEVVALDLTGFTWTPSITADLTAAVSLDDPVDIGLGAVNLAPWFRNSADLSVSAIEHTADGTSFDVFTANYAAGYGFTDEVTRDLSFAILMSLAYHNDVDSLVPENDDNINDIDQWAAYTLDVPTANPGTTNFAGVWQAFQIISLPVLTKVYYPLSIGPAADLVELSMPSLETAPFLEIRYTPSLAEVDFSSLVSLGAAAGQYYGSVVGCGLGVSTAPTHAAPHYDPKEHYYQHNLAMDADGTMPAVGAMETDASDSYSSRHGLWIGYSSFDDEVGMPDVENHQTIHITPRVPPSKHPWDRSNVVDVDVSFPVLHTASAISIVGVSGYSFDFTALEVVAGKLWISDCELGSVTANKLVTVGSAKTFNMYNTVNAPGITIEGNSFTTSPGLSFQLLGKVLGNIRLTYNWGLQYLHLAELRGLVGGITIAHNHGLESVAATQLGALTDMEALTGLSDLSVAMTGFGFCHILEDLFALTIVQNEDLTSVNLETFTGSLVADSGDSFSTLHTVSIKYNDALQDLELSPGLSFSREWSQACARFWDDGEDATVSADLSTSWFDLSTASPSAPVTPPAAVIGTGAGYDNMVWSGFFSYDNSYTTLAGDQNQGQWRIETNPLTKGSQDSDVFPYEPAEFLLASNAGYLIDYFFLPDYDVRLDNQHVDCSEVNSPAWDARSLAYAPGVLPSGMTAPCSGKIEIFSIDPTTIAASDGPTTVEIYGTGWEYSTMIADLFDLGGFTVGGKFQIRYNDEDLFDTAVISAAEDSDFSLSVNHVTLNDDGDEVVSTLTAVSWTDVRSAGTVTENYINIDIDPEDLAGVSEFEGGDFQVRIVRGPSSILDNYFRLGQVEDTYGLPLAADGEPFLHYAGFCQHASDGNVGTYSEEGGVCLCNSGYWEVADDSNPFDAPNCNGRVGTTCLKEDQDLELFVKDAYFVGGLGYLVLRVPISLDRQLVSFTFGGAPTVDDEDGNPCEAFALEKKVTPFDDCTEVYLVTVDVSKFALCGIEAAVVDSVPSNADGNVIVTRDLEDAHVRAFDFSDGNSAAKTWYKYIVDVTSTFSDPTTYVDPATGAEVASRKVSVSNARVVSFVPASFYVYLPTITVTSDHSFEAVVLSQSWDYATSTAEYVVATSARWPYEVESARLVDYPDTVTLDEDDLDLTELVSFKDCAATQGAFCLQRWLLEVNPNVLCNVAGSYTVEVTFGCRDGDVAYGRTTACVANTASISLDDFDGDDICTRQYFDDTTSIAADLNVYDSADYLTWGDSFFLGGRAYFELSLESTGFPLNSAELLAVQVYRSDSVLPGATTVVEDVISVTNVDQFNIDIRFSVSVDANHFGDVGIDETVNYRLVATARMTYDDGSKKRALVDTTSLSPSRLISITNDGTAGTGPANTANTAAASNVSNSSLVTTLIVVGVAVVAVTFIAIVVVVRMQKPSDDYDVERVGYKNHKGAALASTDFGDATSSSAPYTATDYYYGDEPASSASTDAVSSASTGASASTGVSSYAQYDGSSSAYGHYSSNDGYSYSR